MPGADRAPPMTIVQAIFEKVMGVIFLSPQSQPLARYCCRISLLAELPAIEGETTGAPGGRSRRILPAGARDGGRDGGPRWLRFRFGLAARHTVAVAIGRLG